MSMLSRVRHFFARETEAAPAVTRRRFLTGLGTGTLAAGVAAPHLAHADDVEARARAFGIEPGTLVDARGRPMKAARGISAPTIGEVTLFAGNFAPINWAFCDGQLISISQNTALFSVLGTIYGGDGRTTFALPDLRGRFPIHPGQGPGLTRRQVGERGGAEAVVLNQSQLPQHGHGDDVVEVRGVGSPIVTGLAQGTDQGDGASNPTGGNQPHDNMPPFLGIHFIIALAGLYPTQN